jgi:DNA-binding MarR family transcriptional regulator
VRGLSRSDIVTLGVVERGVSMRPGQIATALELDPSVVSRQLATLGAAGLIVRETDPLDGRAELVGVTRLGRERLLQARSAMSSALAERLSTWDLQDIAEASRVLAELATLLSDTPQDTTSTSLTTIESSQEEHV